MPPRHHDRPASSPTRGGSARAPVRDDDTAHRALRTAHCEALRRSRSRSRPPRRAKRKRELVCCGLWVGGGWCVKCKHTKRFGWASCRTGGLRALAADAAHELDVFRLSA